MQLTRRRLFIGFGVGWLLSRVLPSWAAPAWPSALTRSTLKVYVDVIIPADATPSGTDLEVDRQLLLVAARQKDYRRLLDLGLEWLNKRARAEYGRGFPDIDEDGREAIVREAASGSHNTLARVFFERTRADAFFHYYGHPESWRGIDGYAGPPQPSGFMDYMRPPGASR